MNETSPATFNLSFIDAVEFTINSTLITALSNVAVPEKAGEYVAAYLDDNNWPLS